MSPHPHPHINQPLPTYPIPIICNNNKMDMAFLVQRRQSNKCGNVRNDEIINLHLGSGIDPHFYFFMCIIFYFPCQDLNML